MSTIEKLITAFNNLVRVVYMDGQFGHVEGLMYTKDYKVIDAKNDIEFINKTLNELKDNESKYPDLYIQWRIGDHESQTMEPPLLVSIENNEEAAFDYWFIQDRTNGSTDEIIIKANENGEYDISELVDHIGSRWTPESTGKFDEYDDSYDEFDDAEGDE